LINYFEFRQKKEQHLSVWQMHAGYRHFYVKTAKDLKFHTRALGVTVFAA
jgi:hypothetical protein